MNNQPPQAAGAAQPQVFDHRARITVATPTYDFSLTEYYHSSLRECQQAPLARFRQKDGSVKIDTILGGRVSLPNDSHIDRARNVIANIWYDQNETDWLLWIDADIEFHSEDIGRLFCHAQAGHKFVCGLYAMKTLTPTFVANSIPGKVPDPETGLVEVLHSGTGFMMIHRDVLTTMREKLEGIKYKAANNTPWAGKIQYAYFGSGVGGVVDPVDGTQQWLSEDWEFCERWRKLGGVVLADTQIRLRHLGRLLFPPTVAELVDAIKALRKQNHPMLPAVL